MRGGIKIANIGGIEISINWTWLLAVFIIAWSLGSYFHQHFSSWTWTTAYVVSVICAVLLFVTVLLHELAHSFTARSLGLPVNSITLFIFGGVSNLTQEPPTARVELLVAIAGPLASLGLALLFYLISLAAGGWPTEIQAILVYLASVNLLLALFNLIPGFPLDGGRVFRSLIWMLTHNRRRATHIASDVGQGVGVLFILIGLYIAFLGGDVIGGVWLAFIGWFLQSAASATYQQAVMDQVIRGVEVKDVMDQAPAPVSATTPVEALIYQHMLEGNRRAVPVDGPDGSLLGMATLSDVRKLPRDQWPSTPVTQIMTRTPDLVTVTPDEDLRQAMQCLAENSHHQLPVIQDSHLVGMLDRSHVLQWLHMREQVGTPPTGSNQSPLQGTGR